jgi:hypothetical protein
MMAEKAPRMVEDREDVVPEVEIEKGIDDATKVANRNFLDME